MTDVCDVRRIICSDSCDKLCVNVPSSYSTVESFVSSNSGVKMRNGACVRFAEGVAEMEFDGAHFTRNSADDQTLISDDHFTVENGRIALSHSILIKPNAFEFLCPNGSKLFSDGRNCELNELGCKITFTFSDDGVLPDTWCERDRLIVATPHSSSILSAGRGVTTLVLGSDRESSGIELSGHVSNGVLHGVCSGFFRCQNLLYPLETFYVWGKLQKIGLRGKDTGSASIDGDVLKLELQGFNFLLESSQSFCGAFRSLAWPFIDEFEQRLRVSSCQAAAAQLVSRILKARSTICDAFERGLKCEIAAATEGYRLAIVHDVLACFGKQGHIDSLFQEQALSIDSEVTSNQLAIDQLNQEDLLLNAQLLTTEGFPSEAELREEISALATHCEELSTFNIKLGDERSQLSKSLEDVDAWLSATSKVANESSVRQKLESLDISISQQNVANQSLIDASQTFASANDLDAPNKLLSERLRSLQTKLNDLRLQAVLIKGGPTPGHIGPSPHCLLKTKVAKSTIVLLQRDIESLNTAASDLKAPMSLLGVSQAQNETEPEIHDEVESLRVQLHSLLSQESALEDEAKSCAERHHRSIQNLHSRTDHAHHEYAVAHTRLTSAVQDAQLAMKQIDLDSTAVDNDIRAFRKRLEAVQVDVHALSCDSADQGPPLEEMKRQLETLKDENTSLEKSITDLKALIEVQMTKNTNVEKRLSPERPPMETDDRIAKLQKEVERRDAIIARLRNEAQRTKQLEAKLLSTKTNLSVQKQNSFQDAQLAAARSMAQSKSDDTLWFAKTASRRSAKGL